MNRLRLLPILILAAAALFALKAGGLAFRGGYLMAGISPAQAQTQAEALAEGGASPAGRQPDAFTAFAKRRGAALAVDEEGADPEGRTVRPGDEIVGARADILARLAERRKELDERAGELDMRETLLKAAERRVEERIAALRSIEERVMAIERKRDEEKQAQLKGLITMYETMKPKDAARIFSQLRIDLLVELVEQMNARKMAEILAAMENEAAERLTLAIAERGKARALPAEAARLPATAAELPKIEGRRAD